MEETRTLPSEDGRPGDAGRPRRRRWFWRASAAAAAVALLLTGWLWVRDWRDARALAIDNRSSQAVVVYAHTDNLDWYTGTTEVEPRSSGTLRSAAFWKHPESIWITEMYSFPQRQWSCRWDEVEAKGGLVWTDDGANCGERHY